MVHRQVSSVVDRMRRLVLTILEDTARRVALSDLEAGRLEKLAADRNRPSSLAERESSARRDAAEGLRSQLVKASEPLDRHFLYNQLEECLYRSRLDNQGSLLEYESVCEQHHAEIGPISLAFLREDGHLPNIPMYRQMTIMKSKSKDFATALRSAERGLEVYGSKALFERTVSDLKKRADICRERAMRGA